MEKSDKKRFSEPADRHEEVKLSNAPTADKRKWLSSEFCNT